MVNRLCQLWKFKNWILLLVIGNKRRPLFLTDPLPLIIDSRSKLFAHTSTTIAKPCLIRSLQHPAETASKDHTELPDLQLYPRFSHPRPFIKLLRHRRKEAVVDLTLPPKM